MGLTGVIYAAIVVAWAAYLVPLALRRHDEVARSRSIERFSSAMRVLARRGGSSNGRVVVTPPRDNDRVLTPSLKPAQPSAPPAAPARPNRAAARAAAARRRRVLVVLVGAAAATGVVSSFGLIAWWWPAAPLAVVAAFLAVARSQVRRANDGYWSRAAASEPDAHATNVVRRPAARVDTTTDDEPTVTLPRTQAVAAEPEQTAADLTEQHVVAVTVPTAEGGSLWDPLPVTLPTYVDKPVAKRSIRTIDLGEPGTWSSGHSEADTQAAAAARSDEEQAPEPRRAANG